MLETTPWPTWTHRFLLIAMAVLATLVPGPTVAQVRPNLGFFGGGVVPSRDLFDGNNKEESVTFRQDAGAVVGGRLAVHFTRHIALQCAGSYARTKLDYRATVRTEPGAGLELKTRFDAERIQGSAGIAWSVYRPDFGRIDLFLSGGVGVVRRGGAFFEDWNRPGDRTDLAGVFGAGGRVGIGRRLYLRLDGEGYLSKYQVNPRFEAERQIDVLVTGGFELNLRN